MEDYEDLAFLVKKFFVEEWGMTVEIVNNPLKAIEVLKTRSFDVIISDYQMPGMTGIEFLKYVKADLRDTPFIIFTGKSREEVAIEALNNGADFYLQKGGEPDTQFIELGHKIISAAERKRAKDSLDRFVVSQLLNGARMHNLKNRLTEALGYTQLTLVTDGQEKKNEFCSGAIKAIESCSSLANEVSNYYKLDISQDCWCSLKDIISEQEKEFPKFIFKNNIDERVQLFTNPTIIKEVFYNLLENSRRHGGRNVKNITISVVVENDTMEIIYKDDGDGIDLKDKPNIFLRGYGKNTGLGLFLVKELLGVVNMTISETGKLREGVLFEIVIPPWQYRFRQ